MKKQIIRNLKLEEEYSVYKHESGLTILLYPMTGYSSTYALFGTKLGSIDTCFRTNQEEEYTVVPEGVAHFLEHKLFESEDGDAFQLFAKTGASANAFTSFEKTCYLFSSTGAFEESLKSLLTFVQHPYFTQETVEKEQGIIGQEIGMYDDDPEWRVFFNLLTSLYKNNPVRIDIAGTVESIAKIDAELLYKCYHTFYNLNNMVLAIAGNFDISSALSVIEENLEVKDKVTVESKVFEEPQEVVKDYTEQQLSVSIPLFHLGFKESCENGDRLLKKQVICSILLELIAGEATTLYRELYDSGLINQTFGTEVFCGRGYFANIFAGESAHPQKVKDAIIAEIERVRENGLDEEAFQRVKKAFFGRLVRSFNNVEAVASNMVNCHFAGIGLYDSLDVIRDLTVHDCDYLLNEVMQTAYASLSVVKPTE